MIGDRVLVAYATKHGSTTEIAEAITSTLRERGFQVDLILASEVDDIVPYSAVIVGSAVYMGRWRGEAVDFLRRFATDLGHGNVWLFSSGPLDHSADTGELAPPSAVARLAAELTVRGHVMFGGRLQAGAPGIIENLMTRSGAPGDFRDFHRVHSWAEGVARELGAAPGGTVVSTESPPDTTVEPGTDPSPTPSAESGQEANPESSQGGGGESKPEPRVD